MEGLAYGSATLILHLPVSMVSDMAPEQCRAARKSPGWLQEVLADKASLSVSSVQNFELGRDLACGYVVACIQRAFEIVGITVADDAAVSGAGCLVG